MAKLPVISGKDAVKAFEKDGWEIQRRAKSRHIIMKKEGMPISRRPCEAFRFVNSLGLALARR
ncbi:MAG: hypothetical protein SCARUB_04221 [Candidatus Scalindua rubra]|uniref:YcfA-like protein n=1 Tax=Candidatus Scalindua rubra TaxID=1872076 RepID=A0A1E3X4Y3_9BACT|nr:MAG: hypothetical protein SCARUB_04221 [Candidatus Scalindua rubra]